MNRFPTRLQAALRLLALAGALGVSADPAVALVGPSSPAPNETGVAMILSSGAGEAGFCSAAIIAPTILLTAAHCVPPAADLRAYRPDSAASPALIPITAIVRHPLYRPDAVERRLRSIDLALVRSSRPFPGTTPLALSPCAPAPGESLRVLGYGLASRTDSKTGGVLRAETLTTRTPLSAILLWATDPSNQGGGACFGDSGAPILRPGDRRVVAIVDWATGVRGRGCGGLTQAALVAPQLDWIAAVTRMWSR